MAWFVGRLEALVAGFTLGAVVFTTLMIIGWGDGRGGLVSYSSFGWMLVGAVMLGLIVARDRYPRGERLDSILTVGAALTVGAVMISRTVGDCGFRSTVLAQCQSVFTFRQSLYIVCGCFGVGMALGFFSRIFWRVRERARELVTQ